MEMQYDVKYGPQHKTEIIT